MTLSKKSYDLVYYFNIFCIHAKFHIQGLSGSGFMTGGEPIHLLLYYLMSKKPRLVISNLLYLPVVIGI